VFGSGFRLAALVEPEAFAVHLENVDVVGQPVEDGAGEALGAEDLGPFVEGQVRGGDDGAALVALRDDLEEERGACLGERHEAQFVDDEQVLAGEGLLKALQTAFIDCFDKFVDEGRGGREPDRQALLTGRQPEAEGNVGLAGAARAQSLRQCAG